jgi:Holliday junction resolvase
MIIRDLRQKIVDTITDQFGLKTVKTHSGKFTPDSLKKIFAGKTPTVLIAALKVGSIKRIETDQVEATINFAAYIITTDRAAIKKDESALNIVEAFLSILPNNRWGLVGKDIGEPKSINSDNLYSNDTDAKGVAIWTISWQQTARLGVNLFDTETPFSELFGAFDEDDYGVADNYTLLATAEPE